MTGEILLRILKNKPVTGKCECKGQLLRPRSRRNPKANRFPLSSEGQHELLHDDGGGAQGWGYK